MAFELLLNTYGERGAPWSGVDRRSRLTRPGNNGDRRPFHEQGVADVALHTYVVGAFG